MAVEGISRSGNGTYIGTMAGKWITGIQHTTALFAKLALGGVLICEQYSVAFRVKKAFKICERDSKIPSFRFQGQ